MRNSWLLSFFIILLISCKQTPGAEDEESINITIKNNDSVEHIDEQIVLSRAQLKKLEIKWEEGFKPLISYEGDTIPTQVDDLDGDGAWDELVLLLNIDGESTKVLELNPIEEKKVPRFKQRAHAFLGKSPNRNGKFEPVKEEILPEDHLPQSKPPLYQMEGPVWENDFGAFRLYFDIRNGKDIFGKSVSEIMMDTIGLPGGDYHSREKWGMDVLKAGSSLGAGGVAFLIKDEGGKEELFRLGPQVEEMKYELIADGPVRAILRLSYSGVQAGGMNFDVEDEISIWGGSPGYKSEIAISNTEKPIQLVTGIVNLLNTKQPVERTMENYVFLATHDRQSENNDFLGMSLIALKEDFVRFDETPKENAEITHTNTMVLDIAPNKPASYEFLTSWEGRDKKFADSSNFITMIERYIRQLQSPVEIKIE